MKMAERVGFEPTEPVKVQQFSRLPDSTTLAPLHRSLLLCGFISHVLPEKTPALIPGFPLPKYLT